MLESYFKPVLSKHRGVALGLWGEAGIGKSYRVRQSLQQLPCLNLSLHSTVALSVLAKALPKTARFPVRIGQNLEKLEQNETAEVDFVIDTMSEALGYLAPVVLHLEDIHEVSSERLEFIQGLAQAIKRFKGVGFLVTSRTQPPKVFNSLRLAGLSREASDQILQDELKSKAPPEALEWIYSKASGNPLYTLEYLRFLVRQGQIWNNGESWNWRKPENAVIPSTVEALIELTLSQVSQDEQLETLVQTKAFLPIDAQADLIEAVTQLDTNLIVRATQKLQRQGIFIDDAFAHPLYREITLQRLPKAKRQLLARRAVDCLQNQPEQAVMFLDYAELETHKSSFLLDQALQRARANQNDLQTGRLLAKTLEYLPEDQKASRALEAATLLKYSAIEEATRLAELAATLSQDKTSANLLQAELLAIQGYLQEAENLWQHLEVNQPEAYRVGLVRIRGVAHHYGGVLEVYRQSPESFTNPDAATTQWLVRGLAQLGFVDEAEGMICKKQNQAPTDHDKILLLKAASDIAYVKADFAQMEKLEAEIYTYAERAGNLRVMDQALFNRALALEGLGRYKERKVCLEEAMRVCQELGDVTAYMIAQRAFGSLLADLGDYERAEEYLQGARNYLGGIDFFTYLLDCETTLSQFYREIDRSYSHVLALKHAHAALVCANRMNTPSTIADALCTLVMAYLQIGQIQEAEAHLHLAQQILGDLDIQQSQIALIATQAYVFKAKGQLKEAISCFDLARQRTKEQGALLDEQRMGLELDYLRGDQESAKQRVRWFEERGLKHSVSLAKKLFPDSQVVPVVEEDFPRLEVLGPMQIKSQDVLESVRGRKRQELLAVLLEAKLAGHSLSGLEIMDRLYPEEDEFRASNNLRELIHVLRERLGVKVIATTPTGYALGDLESDAEAFLRTGDISLWRGGYLEGVDIDKQEIVSESLYLLLFTKAREKLEMNPKETIRMTKLLLTHDPYNKDYIKLCLQALRISHNHKSLVRTYMEAKERFLELGETLPDAWQDFLDPVNG